MTRLVILADDLTGALDTGVQFAAAGVRTAVTVGDLPPGDCTVAVCDLETRQLTPDAAYARTKAAVSNALAAGAEFLYLKTDSGLRGQIGAELAAVQEAFPQVLFAPAYPENRRVTKGGIHYIDGTPVSQSLFGRDARTPVRHDRVADVLRESRSLPVQEVSDPAALPAAPFVLLADAVTDADLTAWAASGLSRGIRAYSGCAGMAKALQPLLSLPRESALSAPAAAPLLTVCGSISPVSRAQLTFAQKAGIPAVRLRDADPAALAAALRAHGAAILASAYADADVAENNAGGETADSVAEKLAALAASLLSEVRPLSLFVIGGDTLMALTRALPGCQIRPLRELSSGVVLCELRMGEHRTTLVTKSGSFGEADVIVKIREILP